MSQSFVKNEIIKKAEYKSSFRTIFTPDNTLTTENTQDTSQLSGKNEIKNKVKVIINHNNNSINYNNSSPKNKPSLNNVHKKNDGYVLLKTRNMNFPMRVRNECEIYQTTIDKTIFKCNLKTPKKFYRLSAVTSR